jgi:hypothetical protein
MPSRRLRIWHPLKQSYEARHAAPPEGAAAELVKKVDPRTLTPAEATEFLSGMKTAFDAKKLSARSQANLVEQIAEGVAEVPMIETTANGALTTYKQLQITEDLRNAGLSHEQIVGFLSGKPLSKADYDVVLQVEKHARTDGEFQKRLLAGGAEERRIATLLASYKVRGKKG